MLAAGSASTTFDNLTLTPGHSRSFEIYVHLTTAPSGDWRSAYSASDAGSLTITSATAANTPLGSGWYDLGSVTLGSTDASTSVQLVYPSGSAPDQVCMVGYSDRDYYNGAGELTEKLDRDGRATTYQYDGVGREVAENCGVPDTMTNYR